MQCHSPELNIGMGEKRRAPMAFPMLNQCARPSVHSRIGYPPIDRPPYASIRCLPGPTVTN